MRCFNQEANLAFSTNFLEFDFSEKDHKSFYPQQKTIELNN